VKDGIVVLDQPANLPDGTVVSVEPVEQASQPTLAEQFADIIGKAPDLPADLAENHDHYVHGAAKR
jgi:hypothetical protein